MNIEVRSHCPATLRHTTVARELRNELATGAEARVHGQTEAHVIFKIVDKVPGEALKPHGIVLVSEEKVCKATSSMGAAAARSCETRPMAAAEGEVEAGHVGV